MMNAKAKADLILEISPVKPTCELFSSLKFDEMRMAYGAADLVVSRAGSGSILNSRFGFAEHNHSLNRFRPRTSAGKRFTLTPKAERRW